MKNSSFRSHLRGWTQSITETFNKRRKCINALRAAKEKQWKATDIEKELKQRFSASCMSSTDASHHLESSLRFEYTAANLERN